MSYNFHIVEKKYGPSLCTANEGYPMYELLDSQFTGNGRGDYVIGDEDYIQLKDALANGNYVGSGSLLYLFRICRDQLLEDGINYRYTSYEVYHHLYSMADTLLEIKKRLDEGWEEFVEIESY